MKSNLSKIVLFALSFSLISLFFPGKAEAVSPPLGFRVVNQDYLDYPNQVLKWTENGHLWWRFEQSRSDGMVDFIGWSDYYAASKFNSLTLKDCRPEIVSSGVNCSQYDGVDCRIYDLGQPQKGFECSACQLNCTTKINQYDTLGSYQDVNCSSLPQDCYEKHAGNWLPSRCQGRCNSCRQIAEGLKTVSVNGSSTAVNFTGGSCVVTNSFPPPAKLLAGQLNAFGCGTEGGRGMNPQLIDIIKNPGDTGSEYFIKITRNSSDCTNPNGYFQNAANGVLQGVGALPEVIWSYSGAPSNRLTLTIGNSASPQFIGCIKYVSPAKTCSVTVNPATIGLGQTTRVTLNGNAKQYGSQIVNLWLERKDGKMIDNYWKPIVLSPQPVIIWGGVNPYYFDILSGGCISTNYNQCTKAIDLLAPEGDYWLHCDVPSATKPCSGNPFCTYYGGSVNCSGWVPCASGGGSDHVAFKVGGTPIPSCTVTLTPSTPQDIAVGGIVNYTAVVTPAAGTGTVEKVDFSVAPVVGTFTPVSAPTFPYKTDLKGTVLGTGTVTAKVYMKNILGVSDGIVKCSATGTVNVVVNAKAWWQVKDADITTTASSADLISLIPIATCTGTCTPVLGLTGSGGYSGVPIYVHEYDFDSNPGLEGGNASNNKWLVKTQTNLRTSYDYAYFEKLIPADPGPKQINATTVDDTYFKTVGTPDAKGYYWYTYDGSLGDLNITTDLNLLGRKVILFVKNADLNVSGKINFTKGSGFFMAIVGKGSAPLKGNIKIAGTVGGVPGTGPHLEGIYLAENTFDTGVGTSQLHTKGSIVAYGGINLLRTLSNNATVPAEFFEYYPEEMFLFPPNFNTKKIQWKEAAP